VKIQKGLVVDPRFLFLDVIVLNLLGEGRRTNSLSNVCVLSLMILEALGRTRFSNSGWIV